MLPVIGGIAVGLFLKQVNDACEYDEKAIEKLHKAYRKRTEAEQLLIKKNKEAEDCLRRLFNRQQGIMKSSMQRFVNIYDDIVKIELSLQNLPAITKNEIISKESINSIRIYSTANLKPLSSAEMITSFMFGGLGGLIKKDSEHNYNMACKEHGVARTAYRQAENIASTVDILIKECNYVVDILSKLQKLFLLSLNHTETIIKEKGANKNLYTAEDKQDIMTCMNLAAGIKNIIDTPILTSKGVVSNEIKEATAIGLEFAEKASQI